MISAFGERISLLGFSDVGEIFSGSNSASDSSRAESSAALSYS